MQLPRAEVQRQFEELSGHLTAVVSTSASPSIALCLDGDMKDHDGALYGKHGARMQDQPAWCHLLLGEERQWWCPGATVSLLVVLLVLVVVAQLPLPAPASCSAVLVKPAAVARHYRPSQKAPSASCSVSPSLERYYVLVLVPV